MNKSSVALAMVVIVGGLYASYWLGTQRQQQAATVATSAAAPTPVPAAPPPSTAPVPAPAGAAATATPEQGATSAATSHRQRIAHFTHFRVGNRNVKRILVDQDLVWVGTSGGVIRYDPRNDEHQLFDNTKGLLANGVFHLGKLADRLAVGTYGGGLALRNSQDDGWRIYNVPDGLADAFVYDVLRGADGDVWIATWSGANRIRGGQLDERKAWSVYTVANSGGGLPNDWVYALAAGRNGEVWFATEGGLARLANDKWDHWNHERGLGADFELVRGQIDYQHDPASYSSHHARQKKEMKLEGVDVAYNPNYIISLLVDREGIVWCGTWGGGLARFDGKTWRNFTVADGLPGNHVFALHEDAAGQLWVGTSRGLARRSAQGFVTYTAADGLFTDAVFAIASGSDGSLWVGGYGGVAHLSGIE